MTILSCRECGEEVSTAADVCPHCGLIYPARRPKPFASAMRSCAFLLYLFVALPIIFAVCVLIR